MIPLLIFFGGLVVVHTIANRSRIIQTRTGAVFQTRRERRPNLQTLLEILRQGREPEEWVIDDAIEEAYDEGDWQIVAKLHRKFYDSDDQPDDQPDEGQKQEEENEPPDAPTPEDDASPIVVGRNSPFDGVPDDAWDRFVASLETQATDYQGPKHVGRFHHSRERLAQLKIKDVSTPEKQYEALVADLSDARDHSGELIRDFEFQPIAVEGGERPITLSGILAVIKSAGSEHARSWFTNPDDRKKFPKTTEMFSKANGAF